MEVVSTLACALDCAHSLRANECVRERGRGWYDYDCGGEE